MTPAYQMGRKEAGHSVFAMGSTRKQTEENRPVRKKALITAGETLLGAFMAKVRE
jgi:hypothetical protein